MHEAENNKVETKNQEDQEEKFDKNLTEGNKSKRQLRDRDKLKRPRKYEVNLITLEEPRTYEEVIMSPDGEKWMKAREEKLAAHQKNQTWKTKQIPSEKKSIGYKWVFILKAGTSGEPCYKACLCAKGYNQKTGVDSEIFAPVVRYESIRTLLTIAA